MNKYFLTFLTRSDEALLFPTGEHLNHSIYHILVEQETYSILKNFSSNHPSYTRLSNLVGTSNIFGDPQNDLLYGVSNQTVFCYNETSYQVAMGNIAPSPTYYEVISEEYYFNSYFHCTNLDVSQHIMIFAFYERPTFFINSFTFHVNESTSEIQINCSLVGEFTIYNYESDVDSGHYSGVYLPAHDCLYLALLYTIHGGFMTSNNFIYVLCVDYPSLSLRWWFVGEEENEAQHYKYEYSTVFTFLLENHDSQGRFFFPSGYNAQINQYSPDLIGNGEFPDPPLIKLTGSQGIFLWLAIGTLIGMGVLEVYYRKPKGVKNPNQFQPSVKYQVCPKCSTKIFLNHKFCSECGYDISQLNP